MGVQHHITTTTAIVMTRIMLLMNFVTNKRLPPRGISILTSNDMHKTAEKIKTIKIVILRFHEFAPFATWNNFIMLFQTRDFQLTTFSIKLH